MSQSEACQEMTGASEVRYSFLIPSHGRGDQLGATLRALSEIDAPAGSFEVVVVFDGPAPPLAQERVAGFAGCVPLLIIQQDRRGPAAARNLAASRARGEWLVFLDDDCRLGRDFLQVLEPLLPPESLVIVAARSLTPAQASAWAIATHLVVEAFVHSRRDVNDRLGFLPSRNLIVRRTQWEKTGWFDEAFRHAAGEDREFCFRWKQAGGRLERLELLSYFHDDPSGFWTFLQKHHQYGEASARLSCESGAAYSRRHRKFLFEATRRLWSIRPIQRIPLVAGAIMLSQIATFAGYWRARTAPSPSGGLSPALRRHSQRIT